jgi:UTP:GlnB (protein PII) uridylyltransferase
MAPEQPIPTGIEVDKGPNHCYIKVSCQDRRGLLADILMAINALPMEVRRAAITTSTEEHVTDIFEMRRDMSQPDMTADEIKDCLQHHLKEITDEKLTEMDGKRRRNSLH